MTDKGHRCGHAPCGCTVPGGGEYCSEHCRDAASAGAFAAGPCACGHEVCVSDPQTDLGEGGE